MNRLFRGDAGRVRQVLGIFATSTRQDLERLDTAYASQDWSTVGSLAHKMKSGCQQLGEAAAARGLAAIELGVHGEAGGRAIAEEFAATRLELDAVMMRVAAYLDNEDEAGGK
ncbi:Hpt domain-containing protein [Lysobacter sp. Hz 25]|uniref:Hpt domain-containing protein n=1 Tax=Lysobacter sp. Hz 25 TaxID=3383698 RepID=UPI0038D3B442